MSKILFTKEDIINLKRNVNILRVSERSITYRGTADIRVKTGHILDLISKSAAGFYSMVLKHSVL